MSMYFLLQTRCWLWPVQYPMGLDKATIPEIPRLPSTEAVSTERIKKTVLCHSGDNVLILPIHFIVHKRVEGHTGRGLHPMENCMFMHYLMCHVRNVRTSGTALVR